MYSTDIKNNNIICIYIVILGDRIFLEITHNIVQTMHLKDTINLCQYAADVMLVN